MLHNAPHLLEGHQKHQNQQQGQHQFQGGSKGSQPLQFDFASPSYAEDNSDLLFPDASFDGFHDDQGKDDLFNIEATMAIGGKGNGGGFLSKAKSSFGSGEAGFGDKNSFRIEQNFADSSGYYNLFFALFSKHDYI